MYSVIFNPIYMKKIVLLVICLTAFNTFAQSLINMSSWTEGAVPTNGSYDATKYRKFGGSNEDFIRTEMVNDGTNKLVWKAEYNGSNTSTSIANNDGGFQSPEINVVNNTNMSYMFTLWVKRSYSSTNTLTYFGCQNSKKSTDPSTKYLPLLEASTSGLSSNPYFYSGRLPEQEKWYLLVGYIKGFNDLSTNVLSGVYDGTTKQKITCTSCKDFRFPNPATSTNLPIEAIMLRTFMFGLSNVGDKQSYYDPRIYKMDGTEPTIDQLLGVNITYSNKVAVNTYSPMGNYELAVNGEIIAKEVNVQLAGPWPDYVFEKEYDLAPIEQVRDFVNTNKHLPNVPSAKEISENGVNLGEMNATLLKKVEELTLYIINQNEQVKVLKQEVEDLKLSLKK